MLDFVECRDVCRVSRWEISKIPLSFIASLNVDCMSKLWKLSGTELKAVNSSYVGVHGRHNCRHCLMIAASKNQSHNYWHNSFMSMIAQVRHGLDLVLLKTSSDTPIYRYGLKLPEDSCVLLAAHACALTNSIGNFQQMAPMLLLYACWYVACNKSQLWAWSKVNCYFVHYVLGKYQAVQEILLIKYS